MPINSNSLAAGVAAGVTNVQFTPSAAVLQRNILVMGTGLPASYTANGIVVAVPQLITSPAQANALYGAGSMLARLIAAAFLGTNGAVPIYAFPETENSAIANGVITFTASSPAAGSLNIYINGTQYTITTATTDTPTTLSSKAQALINADPNSPVIAAGTTTLTLAAKSKGLWGNFISLAVASQPGDTLPSGVGGSVTTPMASGAGVPAAFATDLTNGLGSGSNQNLLPNGQQVTDIVHGYMQDSTVISALSTYNGVANGFTGNYDRVVGRPFRVLMGDTTTASQPTTLLATATTNMLDRTNGIVTVPGSLTHPAEIAATAIGVMARINMTRAEQNYVNEVLPGVDPGYAAKQAGTRFTDDYSVRNTLVSGGISPTVAQGASVKLQNVVTFYAANTAVAATSNIYREMVNISKIQNITAATKLNFQSEKWQGYTIVDDVADVTNITSRQKARDVGSVIDDLVALSYSFAANAWIYTPAFPIAALKSGTAVQVRTGGDGFTIQLPLILSGVGNIIDATLDLDISLAVLSN